MPKTHKLGFDKNGNAIWGSVAVDANGMQTGSKVAWNIAGTGESTTQSSYIGTKGLASKQAYTGNIKGLGGVSNSQSSSIGPSGLSSSQSNAVNIGGFKIGESTQSSIGRDGLKWHDKINVGGKELNMGFTIPPVHTGKDVRQFKDRLGAIQVPDMLGPNPTGSLVQTQALNYIEGVEHFSSQLASNLSGSIQHEAGNLASMAHQGFEHIQKLDMNLPESVEQMGSICSGIASGSENVLHGIQSSAKDVDFKVCGQLIQGLAFAANCLWSLIKLLPALVEGIVKIAGAVLK